MLLCFVFLLSLTNCSLLEPRITDEEIILQQQETLRFGFSSTYENIEKMLTLDELLAWTNPYASYSSYHFYKTLKTEEQYIYRALEYALVNTHECISIDSKIKILNERCQLIVQFLALDTPLLEQNVLMTCGANYRDAYDYTVNKHRVVSIPFNNKKINVSNFRAELWKKKMTALKEAKTVFSKFKKHDTDIELAEEMYRYVAKNIEYIPYENELGFYRGHLSSFLYDAFINHKTHCDGFTNALALLFAMAGFEQVEKEGYNDTVGHTWNFVKLDGKWYNCDATAGDWIPKRTTSMGAGLYFAFSDDLITHEQNWADMYPACKKSYYMCVDGRVNDLTGNAFYNAVRNGFSNHSEWALVIVKKYNDNHLQNQLNRIATAYSRNIYSYYGGLANGGRAIIVTKTKMFD